MKRSLFSPVLRAVLILLMIDLAVFGPAWASCQQQTETPARKLSISDILKATGDYSEIVKKMSLYYVCQERIQDKENFFTRGRGASRSNADALLVEKVNRQNLLYDYQIIKKGEEFQEKRILLEENGKPCRKENADLATLKVSARNIVFGPVGFFSRYWQKYFNYEFLGEDVVDGRAAVVIRVVPNSTREENNNQGRVWVDAANSRILRIELEPQNAQDSAVSFDGSTPAANYHRHFTWTIDYGIEKNGVRFPSRQTISEVLVSDTGYKIVKREVLFEFTDYRFFTVEVEHKSRP